MCTMGLGPSSFIATPRPVLTSQMPAAVITDNIPIVNIVPFPLCSAPANPTVIAATAAAMGTPTPAACLPVFPAPWAPGVPTVLVNNIPSLDNTCKLMCAYGGTVSLITPGQFTHQIP
jgi:hypothetical protein